MTFSFIFIQRTSNVNLLKLNETLDLYIYLFEILDNYNVCCADGDSSLYRDSSDYGDSLVTQKNSAVTLFLGFI